MTKHKERREDPEQARTLQTARPKEYQSSVSKASTQLFLAQKRNKIVGLNTEEYLGRTIWDAAYCVTNDQTTALKILDKFTTFLKYVNDDYEIQEQRKAECRTIPKDIDAKRKRVRIDSYNQQEQQHLASQFNYDVPNTMYFVNSFPNIGREVF
jgi:hypothetical protein